LINEARMMMLSLIKFEAEWCSPCKTMDEVMKGLDYDSLGVRFGRVDVDSEDGIALARDFNVRAVPTLLLIGENDRVIDRSSGLKTRQWVEEWLRMHTQPKSDDVQ
jgi:thioredoxin 1